MDDPKKHKKNPLESYTDDQIKGAHRDLLEELFFDHYRHRGRIYFVNFVRGIFFGFGSVLGATLLVALTIWLLSLFVEIPFVGDVFKDVQSSIENNQISE